VKGEKGEGWKIGLASTTLAAVIAQPAMAFKITSPAERGTLKSGQTVTAGVDLGRDSGIVTVRYYWYPELGDTLVEQEDYRLSEPGSSRVVDEKYGGKDSATGAPVVAVAALVAGSAATPSFGGKLHVPNDAIGRMRLLAVAEVSRGRLGTRMLFDEIVVMVEPASELQSIEFETDKPLRLGRAGQASTYGQIDSMGKTFELPVVGTFADGVARAMSLPSAGTTYHSSNEKVIKVLPEGLLQIVGNGKTVITVQNRGKVGTLDISVDVNDEPNLAPVADAGANRTVKAGTKVKLSGLKSTDPEGEALYYTWSQVRGSKVSLLDLNMVEASFLAPQVSEKRLFRFKLRVTDKKGADSPPAYVDVVVEP
jgi:hypothetical protein